MISLIQNVSSKFIEFSLSSELDHYNYDVNTVNEVNKVKADGSIVALDSEGGIEVVEIDNDPKTKLLKLKLKEKQFRISKYQKRNGAHRPNSAVRRFSSQKLRKTEVYSKKYLSNNRLRKLQIRKWEELIISLDFQLILTSHNQNELT